MGITILTLIQNHGWIIKYTTKKEIYSDVIQSVFSNVNNSIKYIVKDCVMALVSFVFYIFRNYIIVLSSNNNFTFFSKVKKKFKDSQRL